MNDITETTADLNAALAKAQAQMKPAQQDRTNPHFKNEYATLNSIWNAIREPLSSNGLCVTHQTEYRGDRFVMVTTLRHASGQSIESVRPIKVDVEQPQKMGSGETYAKRYSLMALVGITAADDMDDDNGNGATAGNGKDKTNGNGHISDEQADTIRALITATNTNVEVFLKWANAPSVSDIKASKFDDVVAKLQQKKQSMS